MIQWKHMHMELASEKDEIKSNNIIKRYKIDDVIDDVYN